GSHMLKLQRSSLPGYTAALLTLITLLLLLWPGLLQNTFVTDGFEPHGYCFLWEPRLVWLFVTSDTLIGLSYVAISLTLTYLVYKAQRDIPFHWVFLAFGAFIIACGGTHFVDVLTLWNPLYWLQSNVKLITAVASVATAFALPPLVPRALDMIRSAKISEERKRKLETANRDLEVLYEKTLELDELKSRFFANVS